MNSPLLFQWTGDSMAPLGRHAARCDAEFTIGEIYRCEVIAERSMRSHRHFFATVHEAWLNLPDHLALQFANDSTLRKHALIMKGYRKERKLALSSPEEARKVAAFLKPRGGDEYSIVSVNGSVVIEWTAMSQSKRDMGGPTFQKSKDDVLDFIADLIGVETSELAAHGEAA